MSCFGGPPACAPFAGLTAMSPTRALLPIAAASGVWYGGLTLLGTELGAEWETINSTLKRLNTGLGIAAGIVLIGLVIWFVRRRKASHQARIESLTPFDPQNPDQPAPEVEGLPHITAEHLDAVRRERLEREAEP